MTTYFGTDFSNTLLANATQISRTVLDIDSPEVRDSIRNAASYVVNSDALVSIVENELDLEIPLISRKRLVTSLNPGDTYILMETNLPSLVLEDRTEYTKKEIDEVVFMFIEYKVVQTRGKNKTA